MTVQSSGLNTITLVPAGASVVCTCILITGTTAASWSFAFEGSSNIPYKQIQTITATIASNALTLGLSPCSLDFRSSTATSGATTTRNFTTSISMTVSNGSTLGTTSGVLSKLAVLAIDNAGTVELAVVNANAYGFLDERLLISTTAEGGIGAADSGTVIYSTTARTNVPFRIVGYVESTQATAGAWATSPSNVAGMGGDIQSNLNILTSGTAVASTSGTSIDFTGLPSWVKKITVMFSGVSTSGTNAIVIQLGYSGGFTGATYTSSGGSATSGGVSAQTTTTGLYGMNSLSGGGSGSAGLFSGITTLANISGNTWISTSVAGQNSVAFATWAGGVGTAGGATNSNTSYNHNWR